MSVINRSNLDTSSWMIAINFRCCSGSETRAAVSTALLSEGKRVLYFVGHVGGKSFDGIHPVPQRFGHFPKGPAEISDLVFAAGEIGQAVLPGETMPDPVGSQRQPPQRPGDGAGQVDRQQDRNQQGDTEHLQYIHPDLKHRLVDFPESRNSRSAPNTRLYR